MNVKKETLQGYFAYYNLYGEDATLDAFGLSQETFNRYKREAKKIGIDINPKMTDAAKIAAKLSDAELSALLKSSNVPTKSDNPTYSFEGETVRFGVLTDTHIGSKYFNENRLLSAFEEFEKQNVAMVFHCGDVVEGVSNRAGHVYECSEFGYQAQKDRAVDLFKKFNHCPIHTISGNHDLWYMKSAGADIVEDICKEVPCMNYCGPHEAVIDINGCKIMLWHGIDGSSYATSYRVQKVIESLSGGEKPGIMLLGHTHKMCYLFERNVHSISAGCIQNQSGFMRGKKLAAHTGFTICEATINNGEVAAFSFKFHPFYK